MLASNSLNLPPVSCPALFHPAAVAGAAFYWSFEILVFLVLLNFLLAIIVDAFGQVSTPWVAHRSMSRSPPPHLACHWTA